MIYTVWGDISHAYFYKLSSHCYVRDGLFGYSPAERLFKFWILGCAQFFSLHRHPLYRPVALLRASKVVCRWREKPSRSPADPKFKQSLRRSNTLFECSNK